MSLTTEQLEQQADFFAYRSYWKEGYNDLSDCFLHFYENGQWVGSRISLESLYKQLDYRVCDGYSHNVISSFKENGDWVKKPEF